MTEGQGVNLIAKTRHGKNRLHQHGNPWWVKEVRNGCMLLESNDRTDKGRNFNLRWVDMHDDKDFTWENVQ